MAVRMNLINSQAPDVPELAHQGIFQLSRLSVSCYVKTMKKYPVRARSGTSGTWGPSFSGAWELRIRTKNRAADPEIEFPTKSI